VREPTRRKTMMQALRDALVEGKPETLESQADLTFSSRRGTARTDPMTAGGGESALDARHAPRISDESPSRVVGVRDIADDPFRPRSLVESPQGSSTPLIPARPGLTEPSDR
jgi:hypothetical protein